jgi:hypothetical protein
VRASLCVWCAVECVEREYFFTYLNIERGQNEIFPSSLDASI